VRDTPFSRTYANVLVRGESGREQIYHFGLRLRVCRKY
jgi:hypothetical protein